MKKNSSTTTQEVPHLATRCSAELRVEVEEFARERGWPVAAVIREAVKQYVSSPAPQVEDDSLRVDGRSRSWLSK
jgi:predicted DNA-binding protein